MPVANFTSDQIESNFPNLRVEEIIGTGGQKQVFKVFEENNFYALKLIRLEQGVIQRMQLSRIRREIAAMVDVQSPYLVGLVEANVKNIEGQNCIYYIEDYIEGSTLTERINTNNFLNKEETIKIGECILHAINALWTQRIIHRDIKPDNIILNGPCSAILIDLGIAQFKLDQTITIPFSGRGPGTPPFMAPEVLNYDKDIQCVRTDIFSLGITLIFAYTGIHPFQHPQETSSITQHILNGNKINLESLIPNDECLRRVLDQMTQKNNYERPRNPEIAINKLRSCL